MTRERLPVVLFALLMLICIATVIAPPAGRTSWLLEVGPGLAGVAVLVATYKRFRMSNFVYVCVFVHMLILIYGGIYTYANTPLGNWARDAFGMARNHYDRVGHLALGVFPAFYTREILLRRSPLERGKWLYFIVCSIVLAIGAFWELLEWWATLVVASDVGVAFLGSQGDVWDAQWDMFLALIGAIIAQSFFAGAHDRSIAKLSAAAA